MAKLKSLKCQWCNTKDTIEKIKDKKGYYHPNCHKKYLKDQQFKQKEREELDQLTEMIKEIHEIDLIPHQFYPFLQELRNGSVLFGKVKKQYKKGISYKLITATYKYCKKDIQKAKRKIQEQKGFNSTLGELKYGLAIVRDKISVVKNKIKNKKQKLKERRELIDKLDDMKMVNEKIKKQQSKPKEEKLDITDIFDD